MTHVQFLKEFPQDFEVTALRDIRNRNAFTVRGWPKSIYFEELRMLWLVRLKEGTETVFQAHCQSQRRIILHAGSRDPEEKFGKLRVIKNWVDHESVRLNQWAEYNPELLLVWMQSSSS